MTNKGIPKFPLFDSFFQKMSCPLFGVPTVSEYSRKNFESLKKDKIYSKRFWCQKKEKFVTKGKNRKVEFGPEIILARKRNRKNRAV